MVENFYNVPVYAIDIETVSQGGIANEFTDRTAGYAKNLKDPKKIEAALIANKEKLRATHGLTWWTGKIISISIVEVWGDYKEVFCGHDEEDILRKTMEVIGRGKLIGKNSLTFDFPFMVGRLMRHNIPVPPALRTRNATYDIDTFFGFSSASNQRSKLDYYAHGLSIKLKPMKGSDIQKKYDQIMSMQIDGDMLGPIKIWKEIADYNLHDSEVVANITKRYFGEDREGI